MAKGALIILWGADRRDSGPSAALFPKIACRMAGRPIPLRFSEKSRQQAQTRVDSLRAGSAGMGLHALLRSAPELGPSLHREDYDAAPPAARTGPHEAPPRSPPDEARPQLWVDPLRRKDWVRFGDGILVEPAFRLDARGLASIAVHGVQGRVMVSTPFCLGRRGGRFTLLAFC